MHTQIAKWGNSLALRIPKALAQQLRWQEGDRLELAVNENGEVWLRPATMLAYRLKYLVAGITPDNRRSSTDWGQAQVAEAW
jgi:antitoxin MazE